MVQTPNTASSSYVSAANFFLCYSPQIVSDLLRPTPDNPPPSYLAMCDSTSVPGARLQFHLDLGAGEIESRCSVSNRYSPTDLQALSGVSQVLLWKLNAARAFWSLNQYLKPLTARPQDVPMAVESAQLLELLEKGEAIFSFTETQGAGIGLPIVQQANPSQLLTPNVVARANRLFPNVGLNLLPGGPGGS
jgi:hypothetical protein